MARGGGGPFSSATGASANQGNSGVAGATGYGNGGGNGASGAQYGGGGGGGAGARGLDSSGGAAAGGGSGTNFPGFIGLVASTVGTSDDGWFAGGGGAGSSDGGNYTIPGGKGGGGYGLTGQNRGTSGSGLTNTGSGGGGGSDNSGGSQSIGGKGGSGIVIVRYVAGGGVLPAIANLAAANITPTSADLRGSLSSTGTSDTAVSVYWGTTDQTTNANLWAYTNYFGSGLTNGIYTTNTSYGTSFISGTKCYYNFYAQNASGGVWAATAAPSASFNTLTNPVVTVSAASGLGVGTATLNGTLTSDGGAASSVFFCWSTNDFGTSSTNPWNVVYCGTAASGQSFFTNVTGLTYGIRCWYYAYATNAAGDAWSSPTNFLTPLATGGDISYVTNTLGVYYGVHIFTNTTGTGTLTLSTDLAVEYLVIAGGGAGAGASASQNGCGGGGGGAGGYRCSVVGENSGSNSTAEAKVTLSSGVQYAVQVGAGGNGGAVANSGTSGADSYISNTVSSVAIVRSTGGGGGGYGGPGLAGGCGGGSYATPNVGGAGTVAQGFKGGASYQNRVAGGGGGAGAVGGDAFGPAGSGGAGIFSRITGSLVQRAGGGGGGADTSGGYVPGGGGAGGGGAGKQVGAGDSGTAGTGGGGGGGGTGYAGGSGGSGIVVVRYEIGAPGIWNQPVSAVTINSATLNGYLVTTGYSDTAVCVLWGTNNAVASGAWANTNWFALNQWGNGSSPFTSLALTSDLTYYYTYGASNATANLLATYPTNVIYFITGGVTVDSSGDATAQYPSDMTGAFNISRPAAASAEPLIVSYTTLAGGATATNGVHYALSGASLLSSGTAPSGSVYLAAGVSSVTLTLTPLSQVPANLSAILTVTPGAGNYAFGVVTQQTVTLQAESSGTVQFWTGAANSQWTNAANWTNSSGGAGVVPTNLPYSAVINGGANLPVVLNLASGPFTIAALTLGQSVASTLTFQNGDVSSKRLVVTGDVLIGPNGTLTHAQNGDPVTHRLFLDVSGGLTINSGGKIDVSSMGYSTPTGDGRAGGSHGGQGGPGNSTTVLGPTYGSITNPVDCGRHGAAGGTGYGGGVVVLKVAGSAVINGDIYAKGETCINYLGGGGAGGSINITANAISGNGRISANGGDGVNVSGGGGGGRMAMITAGSGFGGLQFSATAGLGWNGAAGTIYLKQAGDSFGALLVNGGGVVPTVPAATIFTDASYQFDALTTTNQGSFVVGTNAQLNLTGCTLRSDSTTNSITSRLILGTAGSSVVWPSAWTNNGCISWSGTNGVTMNTDLTIASGGILMHEAGSANSVNLSLNSLTVNYGGVVWVKGCGYPGASGPAGYSGTDRNGGSHGGQGGRSGAGGAQGPNYPGVTYDSVTNPVMPGGGGWYNPTAGGGVVIVRAAGSVTVDGAINANGGDQPGGGGTGAGGAVNIVAGDLLGSGSISVNGGDNPSTDRGSGGGGRIAVALTNATTFGSVSMSVAGGAQPGNATMRGVAGTIYLKGKDQAYGKLIIPDSSYQTSTDTTLISPYVTDAVVGDVELQSGARLTISPACTLTVYGNWTNAAGTSAFSGGTVVLAGATPATIWGGNTWSNLTITSYGKVVSFQTNAIQYIYGIPAFSNNVTLQSTSNSVWWYLQKVGAGTQDVGIVQVQDSNATNGWTFRAKATSVNKGHNVNWIFTPPSGTLILMR